MAKDGGPAFPQDSDQYGPQGMSLRDWFAGQALARFASDPETCSWDYKMMAKAAYAQADAMIAEREDRG
jgi:hypothetical protein